MNESDIVLDYVRYTHIRDEVISAVSEAFVNYQDPYGPVAITSYQDPVTRTRYQNPETSYQNQNHEPVPKAETINHKSTSQNIQVEGILIVVLNSMVLFPAMYYQALRRNEYKMVISQSLHDWLFGLGYVFSGCWRGYLHYALVLAL